MFQQPRKPKALQMLEVLQNYMPLSVEQQSTYERLYRGYLGEKKLATFFQNELYQDHLALYDLQLQVDNSECQIDCLLLLEYAMYLIEVKNFQGDYLYDNQRWLYAATKKEIKNPLHQLQRNELLLQEFFTQQQIKLDIIPRIIFVHPEFHLYQAPLHTPIIFPNQLKRFVQTISAVPKPLQNYHQNLANQITKHHQSESSYEKLPVFDYRNLKKGVYCSICRIGMQTHYKNKLNCPRCNQKESIETAIVRSILAFRLLFPNEKLTVDTIYYWCGEMTSKRSIQRILSKHFSLIRYGKESYYIKKQISK